MVVGVSVTVERDLDSAQTQWCEAIDDLRRQE
jgi:hypothetical protein